MGTEPRVRRSAGDHTRSGPGSGIVGTKPPAGLSAGMPPELQQSIRRMLSGTDNQALVELGVVRDVLSEVLDSVSLRALVPGLSSMAAPWGIAFPGGPCALVYLTRGAAWVEVPLPKGGAQGASLCAGDLVLINAPSGHSLMDEPGRKAVSLFTILSPEIIRRNHGLSVPGPGAASSFISAALLFDRQVFSPLVSGLPPIMHIRGDAAGRPRGWVGELMSMIMAENQSADGGKPGRMTVVSRLVEVVFVNAVRDHLAEIGRDAASIPVGWLRALMSADLGPSLGVMHLRPEVDWSVESLAEHVHLSRSVFAKRFTDGVGMSPMRYLLECRMRRASAMLRTGTASAKQVAAAVGYSSEAAFGSAFKRWAGVTPGSMRSESGTDATPPRP